MSMDTHEVEKTLEEGLARYRSICSQLDALTVSVEAVSSNKGKILPLHEEKAKLYNTLLKTFIQHTDFTERFATELFNTILKFYSAPK